MERARRKTFGPAQLSKSTAAGLGGWGPRYLGFEGAWTCEGPKVGGEDFVGFKIVLRSTDLEPLAGQLMLSLVTWMCQLVLRGRRATAPSTLWDTSPCGCSFGWSGKLGEPLHGDSSGVFSWSLC